MVIAFTAAPESITVEQSRYSNSIAQVSGKPNKGNEPIIYPERLQVLGIGVIITDKSSPAVHNLISPLQSQAFLERYSFGKLFYSN